MSVVPGEIVKRRGKLSLKSPAVICEPVSACTVGCAERRRRFMSDVPEGYAEGGGDL